MRTMKMHIYYTGYRCVPLFHTPRLLSDCETTLLCVWIFLLISTLNALDFSKNMTLLLFFLVLYSCSAYFGMYNVHKNFNIHKVFSVCSFASTGKKAKRKNYPFVRFILPRPRSCQLNVLITRIFIYTFSTQYDSCTHEFAM